MQLSKEIKRVALFWKEWRGDDTKQTSKNSSEPYKAIGQKTSEGMEESPWKNLGGNELVQCEAAARRPWDQSLMWEERVV